MARRQRRSYRVLLAAATLALVPASEAARAQSVGLRGSDSVGGFPGSPSAADVQPRDRVSPPAPDASPSSADEQSPATVPSPNPSDEGGPNYGKLRKRPPKLYKAGRKGSPPLSPLVPYRGAPGVKKVLNPAAPPPDAIDPKLPAPTVAVLPSPPRVRKPPEEIEPFAPTGIRAGQFILRPFIEANTGYETNPNQVTTGVKPSAVLQTNGGLDLSSDLSSGSLTGSLRGGYADYPSNSTANRPNMNALVDGRIDVTRNDTIDTEARFLLTTQQPGSALLAVPNSVYITNRPLITSEGATLGGTHLFGPLSVGLKSTFDRTTYGDGQQNNGTVYPFSRDNYNDYGLVLRTSYELTPAIIPFVEIGADSRVRDNPIDISGYARDSVGGTARAGVTVDLMGDLKGNASAGYLERHYADSRLVTLRGPTFDANLVYAVTPLTTATLRASTTASETIVAGAAGAISRSVTAELAHVFFRRFTLTGIATYQPNDYQGIPGHEVYTTFTLKGAYSLSREVQLIASASHENLKSSFVGQGFSDNIFLLGVRLQR